MVETRVESLEKSMQAVNVEIQLMSHTMRDIAETLKEIKEDQRQIQRFEVQKAVLERDILDMKKLTDTLFKKLDLVQSDIQTIKESNAGSVVKLGYGERVLWILVSTGLAALNWARV